METRRTRGRHGFTLIEIMAVVLIIGLTLGFFLPNLGATRARRLEDRAREVAAVLYAARERAMVTGSAHRLWLHLEDDAMRVDWYVTEDRAYAALGEEEEPPPPASGQQYDSQGRISLSPPQSEQPDWFPVPNMLGREQLLPDDCFFESIDYPDGFAEEGEAWVTYGRDGTTDYAEITMVDSWENRVVLEIEPLLDAVRVRPVEEL